jgi:hypothetical protein
MSNRPFSAARLRPLAIGLMASMFAASGVAAQTECGLCEKEVVINADLATCFLERYGEISRGTDATVVVDLSDCTTRGIVEALPGPDAGPEPDTMFMVSQEQLECLKQKLEDPDLVLDPAAKIDLESCG